MSGETVTIPIDEIITTHERVLPSRETFKRHRCKLCSSYWDTDHPRLPDEPEFHHKGCLLVKYRGHHSS